jgi:hypothetical protein
MARGASPAISSSDLPSERRAAEQAVAPADLTVVPPCLRPKRRRPARTAFGGHRHTPRRFVSGPVEYNPKVGVAIIDSAVAHGFPVIGLLASRHQNQLQRHPVRVFEHGVRADLDGGSVMSAMERRSLTRVTTLE